MSLLLSLSLSLPLFHPSLSLTSFASPFPSLLLSLPLPFIPPFFPLALSLSHSGTINSLQTAADSHPTLQFSLYYDIQRRVLAVHIQQAYNLPVVTKGAATIPCSPFILLFLLPSKEHTYESRISHRDLNPSFNQIFDFPGLLPEDIRKQTLVMKAFHSRKTKHDLIGQFPYTLHV